jgi:4-amino-4-deoxy-L-arabinose transferase-like glycosyltransferase
MLQRRRLWLVLILFAAFALRVHALGAKSLWYDELRQIEVASHPLAGFPTELAKHSARPLDYWLTHYLLRAGRQEFWLRFPALMWGTLSVALMFVLARSWFDGRTALLAAALMAAAPIGVQYVFPPPIMR